MIKTVNLNADLRSKYITSKIKAVDLVQFLLDEGFSTTKEDINKTAIVDLTFEGRKALSAKMNCDKIEIGLSEEVEEDSKQDEIVGTELYINYRGDIEKHTITSKIEIKGKEFYTLDNVNTVLTLEQIKEYMNRQQEFIIRKQRQEEYKLECEKQETEEKALQEKKEREYNFCYGYTDNKTALQQGKILKCLNVSLVYNNKSYTRKQLIHKLISENENTFTKVVNCTNRYSDKKINLEYKKLKDKIEYRFYVAEDEYFTVTKTEYDYINYLIENNIKIKA